MATKLHLHLDELDELRPYMSPQQQRIGVRRYIASKANLDISDVAHLEFYGLDGCPPSIANRIFEALGEAEGKHITDQEKFRLLQKTSDEAQIQRTRDRMYRERSLDHERRNTLRESRCYE